MSSPVHEACSGLKAQMMNQMGESSTQARTTSARGCRSRSLSGLAASLAALLVYCAYPAEDAISSRRCRRYTSVGVRVPFRATLMTLTIEAIYENGVLKPSQPLPLQEREKVRITVQSSESHVRRSAGLIGWTGSQEDADFVALSPEVDPQEDA